VLTFSPAALIADVELRLMVGTGFTSSSLSQEEKVIPRANTRAVRATSLRPDKSGFLACLYIFFFFLIMVKRLG
jgi:hypothetical protein